MSKELLTFSKVTTVNNAGELMVNAGRYSRGAVIAAFEMIGGLDTFAEWADEIHARYAPLPYFRFHFTVRDNAICCIEMTSKGLRIN